MNMFKGVKLIAMMAVIMLAGMGVWNPWDAFGNHPVLLEGNNCANAGPGTTSVPARTCGDYDGDGLIGTAEDTDNSTDRIFGTLTAALGAANGGANQNGKIIIVTSGRFPEQVIITGANGNVTIEAAPGVEADIDAVLAGDANNGTRQGQTGIIVNAPFNRMITLRNLEIRNWLIGIEVMGDSNVNIDNCRIENNVNYGILVSDTAAVAITNTQVNATGFRVGATGDFPGTSTPDPGIGIEFEDSSSGAVAFTTITGSFSTGLANSVGGMAVRARGLVLFNNNPNTSGPIKPLLPPF